VRKVVCIILFILCGLLAACDETEDRNAEAGKSATDAALVAGGSAATRVTAPKRPVVGLVMKTLTNPFFIEMERGAREAAQDFDLNLLVRTAAQETSVEQQIVIVEDLAADGVDAIVIAPGDSVRLIPPLKAAQDQGIVVVNIDNRLDPGYAAKLGLDRVPFISVDNEQGAYLSARTLVASASGSLQAAILEGIPTAANAQARKRGAARAFAEVPGVDLVASRPANWKIDEGYAVTGGLLRDYPSLDVLFAANDMMALGALQRLREMGRQDVRVAAYDALAEARDAVRAGRLVATVDQKADRQGYLGVEYAVRLMAGETVPAETYLEIELVTGRDPS